MARITNRRATAGALLALAVSAVLLSLSIVGNAAAQPTGFVLYLPHLDTNGPPPTATPPFTPTVGADMSRARVSSVRRASVADASPHGIESWGESQLDLQNLAGTDNQYEVELVPGAGNPVRVSGVLDRGGYRFMDLVGLSGIIQARYRATIRSAAPVGALARTQWLAGGASAVEASEPADRLILPLMAKTVFSHTTYIFAQNTHEEDEDNLITFETFEPTTGDSISSTSFRLQRGESVSWDTSVDLVFDDLPDSFLGALRIESDEPVAVLAYGDELARPGASAYRARPLASAATEQMLPSVHADAGAESMIVVANASESAAEVGVAFVGAPDSPAGADQRYDVSFSIAPRGTSVIDLSTLRRGNVDAPNLPRGFRGSAAVRATSPVLAMVLDTRLGPGRLGVESSAYNAFGPADMSATWIAPALAGSGSAQVVIGNPAESAADVSVAFQAADGSPLRTTIVAVGAGASGTVQTTGLTSDGPIRAHITAPWPVAVVVKSNEHSDPSAYWAFPMDSGSVVPTLTPTGQPSPLTPGTPVTVTPTPTRIDPSGCGCSILLPWSTQR